MPASGPLWDPSPLPSACSSVPARHLLGSGALLKPQLLWAAPSRGRTRGCVLRTPTQPREGALGPERSFWGPSFHLPVVVA